MTHEQFEYKAIQDAMAAENDLRQLKPRNAINILEEKLPPVDWVVESLLPIGLHLLTARPKAGKSYLALQAAKAVATGGCVFPNSNLFRASRGAVCYADLECSTRQFRDRAQKIGITSGMDGVENIFRLEGDDGALLPLSEGGIEQVDELLEQGEYRLLILDTLLAAVAAGGSNRDPLRSEYKELQRIRQVCRQRDSAILVVHHTRKAQGGSPLDNIAGTSGISAAVDGMMMLETGSDGRPVLHCVNREAAPLELALSYFEDDVPGWSYRGDADEISQSDARRQVQELLAEDGPQTANQVARNLERGLRGTRYLLGRMAKDGLLRKENGKFTVIVTAGGRDWEVHR